MTKEKDDRELVEEARAGSQEAMTELVRRFQRPVYSLILRMVHDRGLAEDLSQEAFVNAFRKLDHYDPERRFASWLFKIAHNRTLDHLRRKRLATVALEGSEESLGVVDRVAEDSRLDPDRTYLQGEIMEAFEDGLANLRPEYRTAIVLRFQEGLAYREIADVMELPLATVKTHIHRARKALADELERRGFGPGEI